MTKVKDIAIEKSLLMLLGPMVKRYGLIRRLSLDTKARTLAAEISLHGDAVPLELISASYRVEDREGQCYVILSGFRFSKAWVQHLAEDHFPEIALKTPPAIRPFL